MIAALLSGIAASPWARAALRVGVVSDEFEPVSVDRHMPEPMLNKAGATQRGQLYG